MTPTEPDGEAITPEGLTALKTELHDLETVGRRAMAKRILAARELGDLKENAEYHIAKEDQSHLETRILRLRQRLRKAVIVETTGDEPTFAFGRTAEILDEGTGAVSIWTIVGPTEASAAEGKLSSESPVARAMMGHAPGDLVEVTTPRGTRRLRVQKLL